MQVLWQRKQTRWAALWQMPARTESSGSSSQFRRLIVACSEGISMAHGCRGIHTHFSLRRLIARTEGTQDAALYAISDPHSTRPSQCLFLPTATIPAGELK